MRSLSKVQQQMESTHKRLANLKAKAKKTGQVGRRLMTSAGSSLVTGFLGQRFLTGDGETYANVKGVPVEPIVALGAVVGGLYAESDFFCDVGTGIASGASHDLGKYLAVLSKG